MSHADGNNDDYTDMNDSYNQNDATSSNKQSQSQQTQSQQQSSLLVQQDLDAFLSLLEAKLRGPFSSLDLAKTIITNQLRNGSVSLLNTTSSTTGSSITKEQYIETIGLVLGQAEKTTQLRTLIGFLGLDPDHNQDTIIQTILSSSQQNELYVEEWVRVISGLVHGIMYASSTNSNTSSTSNNTTSNNIDNNKSTSKKRKRNNDTNSNNNEDKSNDDEENYTDDEDNDNETDKYDSKHNNNNNSSSSNEQQQQQSQFVPLRGEEADMIITKTCTDIINRVRAIEQQTKDDEITFKSNNNSTTDDDDDDDDDSKKKQMQLELNSTLYNSDVDTTFVPYWYTLVNEELLEQIIPENKQHYHFTTTTNATSTVLTMDTKIEIAKAQEEYDHALQTSTSTITQSLQEQQQKPDDNLKRKFDTAAILPGMNRKLPPTNNNNNNTRTGTVGAGKQRLQPPSKSNTAKSSLFLPSNKRSTIGTSNFTKPSIKPLAASGTCGIGSIGLKLRKPGAAQDLLKSRKITLIGNSTTAAGAAGANAKLTATATTLAGRSGGSTLSKIASNTKNNNAATNITTTTKAGTTSLVRGRANRLLQNGGASKVKMMDTDEINDLEQAKLIKDQQQLPNSKQQKLSLASGTKKIKIKGKSTISKSTSSLLDNNNDSNHSNDKSKSVVDDGDGDDDDDNNYNDNDNYMSPKQRKRQKTTDSKKGEFNELGDVNIENNNNNHDNYTTMNNKVQISTTAVTGLSIHNNNENLERHDDNDNNDQMEDYSNHTFGNNNMSNMTGEVPNASYTIAAAAAAATSTTTTMLDNVNNYTNSHINKGNNNNSNIAGRQYSFATDPGALAAAALNMYQAKMSSTTIPVQQQQQQQQQQQYLVPVTQQQQQVLQHHNHNNNNNITSPTNTNSNKHSYVDWRKIIQETSNKLSNDDKFRIQQFFVDKYNPTPEQTKIKLKLHENRITDNNTGEINKETYYLELDYTTFTSIKSKKIKKYSN